MPGAVGVGFLAHAGPGGFSAPVHTPLGPLRGEHALSRHQVTALEGKRTNSLPRRSLWEAFIFLHSRPFSRRQMTFAHGRPVFVGITHRPTLSIRHPLRSYDKESLFSLEQNVSLSSQ